jgi:hypothetical protein
MPNARRTTNVPLGTVLETRSRRRLQNLTRTLELYSARIPSPFVLSGRSSPMSKQLTPLQERLSAWAGKVREQTEAMKPGRKRTRCSRKSHGLRKLRSLIIGSTRLGFDRRSKGPLTLEIGVCPRWPGGVSALAGPTAGYAGTNLRGRIKRPRHPASLGCGAP